MQHTALISKNGMSCFAPISEFEFPTRFGASGINTLAGFTTSLGTLHLSEHRLGSGHAPLLRRAALTDGWMSPGTAI